LPLLYKFIPTQRCANDLFTLLLFSLHHSLISRLKNLSSPLPIEQIAFKGLKHTKEPIVLKKYVIKGGEGSGTLAPITNHSDLEPGVYLFSIPLYLFIF
jgi:hypothetical protein